MSYMGDKEQDKTLEKLLDKDGVNWRLFSELEHFENREEHLKYLSAVTSLIEQDVLSKEKDDNYIVQVGICLCGPRHKSNLLYFTEKKDALTYMRENFSDVNYPVKIVQL